jgi:hypothetical protein
MKTVFRLYYKGELYEPKRPFYQTRKTAEGAITSYSKSIAREKLGFPRGAVLFGTKFDEMKSLQKEIRKRDFEIREEVIDDTPKSEKDKDKTYCPHCEKEMDHIVIEKGTLKRLDNGGIYDSSDVTHIYSCPDCPNILIEFIEKKDIEALEHYLYGEKI